MSREHKYPVATDGGMLDPLKIELILARVFSFLKPKDLKNCRLVCKLWKDESTDELGSQTYLVIRKLQDHIRSGSIRAIRHPRLLQQIKIQLKGVTEVQSVSSLVPFLTNHLNQVKSIRIQGPNYFLPPLKTILESVDFPNLSKISLEEEYFRYFKYFSGDTIPPHGLNPTLAVTLNSVKILEIVVSQNGSGGTTTANFSTFQLLINKCPNLEGMKISWHFYPDLSSCTKLKSLAWVGGPMAERYDYALGGYYLTYQTWALLVPKLIEMLEPVKDTLESLTLGSTLKQEFAVRGYQDNWTLDPEHAYLYPCMSKLIKLTVSDVMMFCIHEDSFIQSRLPALKILTLSSNDVLKLPIKAPPLLNKWKRYESKVNAETLSLNQFPVGEVEMISDIATTFPNLKKLTLGITDAEKSADDDERSTAHNAQLLKNTLNAISQWLQSLIELTIHIKFSCTLEELMDGLCAEGFTGKDLKLKVVVRKFNGRLNMKDNGCDNFGQTFTLYHKGLSLEGFQMRDDTREKMCDFIRERNLLVDLN